MESSHRAYPCLVHWIHLDGEVPVVSPLTRRSAAMSFCSARSSLAMPSLLERLAALGCPKVVSQWDRCGQSPYHSRRRKETSWLYEQHGDASMLKIMVRHKLALAAVWALS